MTAIVDYGAGNLFSLVSSLSFIGEAAVVTGDPDKLRAADRIILPGVGAFGEAADLLRERGLSPVLKQIAAEGKPFLGICLGMQLLFDESEEFGRHEGLSLIPGRVVPIESLPGWDKTLKIPHIGWNPLTLTRPSPLFREVNYGDCVYFVHSYCAVDCGESVTAAAEYSVTVTAAVERGNVFGCQFHPEKSGSVGLRILRAFCGLTAENLNTGTDPVFKNRVLKSGPAPALNGGGGQC